LANNMFVIVQLCNHMGTKKRGQTHKVRLHNPYDCPYVVRISNVCLELCPNPLHFFPKELTFGKIQTSLLLLSLNRSFVLIQENEAKENQG